MSQVFHCVKCFSCECFQVHQVKKVNKWSCKVCGVKQSLLKEYGRGSGADCRRQVQKLNVRRGAKMEEEQNGRLPCEQTEEQVRPAQSSRWNKYLHPPEEVLNHREHLHSNHSGMTERRSDDGPTPDQLVTPPNSPPLSVDCQAHGRSLKQTGAETASDITNKPRPPIAVSMFESGEDFSSDIF